jgi:hypothetical protein
VSRKDVRSFEKDAAKVRAEKNVSKAVADARALQQKAEKKPETIRAAATALVDEQLARAGKELDTAEQLLGEGKVKEAQKVLSPLARALKGTSLEGRLNELLEKTKV